MQLACLRQPFRAAVTAVLRPAVALGPVSAPARRPQLQPEGPPAVESRRWASVKSQGAYKIPNKKTRPKKMGAKKSGDQHVITGNIIYKQRGTIWHAGENTILGRDHTIHAACEGYVKYYRDPSLHPHRQYIGVAHNRDDTLPYPKHGVRRRKLGMVAQTRKKYQVENLISASGIPRFVVRRDDLPPAPSVEDAANPDKKPEEPSARPMNRNARKAERARVRRASRVLLLRDDYSYRETNAALGRLTSRAGGRTMGTTNFVSRRGLMRARRVRREHELRHLTQVRQEKLRMQKEMREERTQQKGAGKANIGHTPSPKKDQKKAKDSKKGGSKAQPA